VSLLNNSKVKNLALEVSKTTRNGRFTRVGQSFLARIEAQVAALVRAEVLRHPSKGKTLL
jgi:hypothetical protein